MTAKCLLSVQSRTELFPFPDLRRRARARGWCRHPIMSASPRPAEAPAAGYPGRLAPRGESAVRELGKRTLTSLHGACPQRLAVAHAALDGAVAFACGQDPDIADEEALSSGYRHDSRTNARQARPPYPKELFRRRGVQVLERARGEHVAELTANSRIGVVFALAPPTIDLARQDAPTWRSSRAVQCPLQAPSVPRRNELAPQRTRKPSNPIRSGRSRGPHMRPRPAVATRRTAPGDQGAM